jgi:UDP-N-acetylglucosamine--dolichyl-phosphate N-acetylglucosaminephosphotransferase
MIGQEWTALLPLALSASAFPLAYLATRKMEGLLKGRGMQVPDVHKEGEPLVARPGGPAILLAMATAMVAIGMASGDIRPLSVAAVASVAGLVGLIDDLRTLSGPMKVALLFGASLPILLMGTYSPFPVLPFVGRLRLTIIYPFLVLVAIPVTANTFNMIDVYNGLLSGFSIIAAIPFILAFALTGDWAMAGTALAFSLAVAGFYPFHRNPARVFPGDSGSLAVGAAFGAMAIVGHMEVVGVVALIPAVLNSFFVLSSVRGFMEHRNMKKRPVRLRADWKIEAVKDEDAPMTLSRMLLAGGPLTEEDLVKSVYLLEAYSAALALVTLGLTWWS